MFESPTSWLTLADFFGDAHTVYGDSFDNPLPNHCSECQQNECEHQRYQQQQQENESYQMKTKLSSDEKPSVFAGSLRSQQIPNTNDPKGTYVPLDAKQQQLQLSFSDCGFRSSCGTTDGSACSESCCDLGTPKAYPEEINLLKNQKVVQPAKGFMSQRSNLRYPQSANAILQHYTTYPVIPEESNSVTVYPPRNYPALEVVPGITYPIGLNSSQNINVQPEYIPIHQQQQLQQQSFQNQYLTNQQLLFSHQYQNQNGYSQQIFHQQIEQTSQIRYNQLTAENSSQHLYNTSNASVLPSSQQHSGGFYQPAPTGVHSLGVQQLLGHLPCRGNAPWSYSYCYGDERNNHEPCHFIQCVDIEDFLNNEKRKEKSRDAARCRRSRETEIFTELAQILPLRKEDVTQLDKASIMRIAIAFLKVREMLQMFPSVQDRVENFHLDVNLEDSSSQTSVVSTKTTEEKFDLLKCAETSQFIKQTLDGFLIILSNDGDITYVSDNVTDYLGLAKIDILGQQIWEYSHQCDHAELKDALNIKRNSLNDKIKDENKIEDDLTTDHRDLFVRLKCTLTSRGRSINIKSASYKVIHITGHLVANMKGERVLVGIGRPIPHPSNIEIPLGSTTFLTKHSLDMKFTYVDEKMHSLLGYKASDLLEQTLFAYHHGGDSERLMAAFKTVLGKGQGETCRYRFLGKYGGYCWIVTQATIVYDKMKPQSVVCVNYVISNLENNDDIYSLAQYEASKLKVKESDSEDVTRDISDNGSYDDLIKQNISINVNSNDDNKSILKECQSIENNLQKQQENQEKLNKNCKNDLLSIKSINQSPTTPIPLPTLTTDNDLNEDPTNNSNKTNNLYNNIVKREQSPIIDSKPITTSATPPINNRTNLRENSLSPLRRNLQTNCFIGSNKSLNANKNNIESRNKNPFIQKPLEEKRPKSVTASVFRPATSVDLNTSSTASLPTVFPSTTSTSAVFTSTSNPSLPSLYAATRAQSVTASVFTPISQLCLKQQQQQTIKTNSITSTPVAPSILSGQQQQSKQSSSQITTKAQTQQQQDMNKFLSFGDDATELTMLKEEPDDLAHFTPASVDACMRLDETAPFCGEMLLGLCSYAYSNLLPDDYSSLDSTTNSSSPDTPNQSGDSTNSSTNNQNNNTNNNINNNNGNSPTHQQSCNSNLNTVTLNNNNNNKPVVHIDPFINYREESNDTTYSQHLLSPSVASKSPDASSLPSLCSPNSLSQDDGFAFMTMSVDEDIDMTMRAPYIPMNEQEDLPLLTADDLMWCASNGLGSDELNNQKDIDATLQQLQSQQQQSCNPNLLNNFHDVQHISQSHFNSLCSSPASTVSSLSPSPVNHHQQQQQHQQQESNCVYNTDTSELAALLCGSGNGTLSILNNNCGGSGSGVGMGVSNVGSENIEGGLQQQAQQQQSHCVDFRLQQLQQELAAEHQEQQKRQMQMLGLNIDCKKESSLSPSLCGSIEDAFDNAYSKDSTNLDCWNDLLQINVGETSTSPSPSPAASLTSPQQQQLKGLDVGKSNLQRLSSHQQQQSIILNAVPLITIQNAKNIMLQQQQQQHQNSVNKMIFNDEMLPVNRGGNKITTIKLVNSQTNATTVPPTTVGGPTTVSSGPTTTIRLIDATKHQQEQQLLHQRQQQQQQTRISQAPLVGKNIFIQHQQPPQQPQSHKRHLVSFSPHINQHDTKRLKSIHTGAVGVGMEMHAMPQLLQQLVSSSQLKESKDQQQQSERKANGAAPRWSTNADTKVSNGLQQQSNSVLKNLLISGCDVPHNTNQKVILINEDSLEQAPTTLLTSLSSPLTNPLHCQTETAAALRNFSNNPMIGGPCELPSPPLGPTSNNNSCIDSSSDESSLPGLTSAETDSNSDSGIDEIERSCGPTFKTTFGCTAATKDMLLIKCLSNKAGKKRAAMDHFSSEPQIKQQQPLFSAVAEKGQRNVNVPINAAKGTDHGNNRNRGLKDSMTEDLDNMNPLMEPFIMDLCNDNYDVETAELLQTNEIDQVLSGWTNQLA